FALAAAVRRRTPMDRTPLPLYAHLPSARPAPRARLRATAAWASVVALCGAPLAAGAQEAAALRASPQLAETIPEAARARLPVCASGERMWGGPDERAVVEGDAELRRGDTVIRADRLEYTVPDDRANATGKVRINRAGN